MEVKTAQRMMKFGLAVKHKDRRYERINAIISRQYVAGEEAGSHRMQAEIWEGRSNSVQIVPVSELEFADLPPADPDNDADA